LIDMDTLFPIVRRLLNESAPSRVADAAELLAGEELATIAASLPGALAGNREQVRLYAAAYGRLSERVLEAVEDAYPDLAAGGGSHRRGVLWGEAMNAPFTDWVGSLDPGRGTAVAMVARLRQILPAGRPLSPPSKRRLPSWEVDDADIVRFYRAVSAAIEGAESPLERIREVFTLNRTEAAALFGVRRQALEGWERNGVPAERQRKLATLAAIADLLSVRVKADRVAAVVRRPAPAYGERSILDAIAAGEEEHVLDALRAGFDWASAA
jgi:DNA-binding XRE family transcriptional regulator